MDQNDALRISRGYLQKLKSSAIEFSDAYLFGSFARGNQHEDSDIDIAIVLKDNILHTFNTDIQLMTFRQGEETLIEPHAFSKDEFDYSSPLVHQIMTYGVRIEL